MKVGNWQVEAFCDNLLDAHPVTNYEWSIDSQVPGVSRLQRDLTDSTVLRNIGVPVAHSFLALRALEKGMGKLLLNPAKLQEDLEHNWAVVAEAIQTILRREGYPNPYEALKELTRTNTEVNAQTIAAFVETLNVSEAVRNEIRQITPHTYTGI